VMGGGGALSFNSLMVFSCWVPEIGAAGWLDGWLAANQSLGIHENEPGLI